AAFLAVFRQNALQLLVIFRGFTKAHTGRVGHRPGTTHIALFPWPPAERRLQVSKHGALQCLCPFPVSIRPVVAFSIADTSLLNTPSTCLASPCGQLS